MNKTLHFQLLAAHTYFQRVFLKRLQDIYPDILPGQPKVIDFLMYQKHAYQKEIADACLIEPPTLSLILEKMERVGLISRQKSIFNNKNIVVQLTEKGESVGRKAQEIFLETEKDFCKNLSPEESEMLPSLLQKICDSGKEL